jgi:hypothetical protein
MRSIIFGSAGNVVQIAAITINGTHTTKTVGLPHGRGHGELYDGVA